MTRERRIRVIETGRIYPSIAACARAIDGIPAMISRCLNTKQKKHRGFTFEYVANVEPVGVENPAELLDTLKMARTALSRDLSLTPLTRRKHKDRLDEVILDLNAILIES